MRAVLVDPFKREVREVRDNFMDFKVIKQYLAQGDLGDKQAPFCSGPRLTRDVHTYVDDEGYYRPDQGWFFLKGYGPPLAGFMLILGDRGDGDEADCPDWLTADKLATLITWTDEQDAAAKIPPMTVTQLDRDFKPGKVVEETHIDISSKRPL